MIARAASPDLLPAGFAAEDLPLGLRFGGHRCRLRALQAGDTGLLLAFFASHTAETIYQRYGYYVTEMTPEHAARLVEVDQHRDAALGVFELTGETERLIAIGRYCLGADDRMAEMAFVVHEDRRSLGIATTLLAALRAIAADRGLAALVAQVEYDNAPMLAVFRRARAVFTSIPGTPSLQVTLRLRRRSDRRRQPHGTKAWLRRTAAQTALGFERATECLRSLPTP